MLSPKREAFCLEYIKDRNGTQAAIRAGYSQKTANEQAAELLAIPSVRARVEELSQALAKRALITAEEVLEGLKQEARATGEGTSHAARVSAWKALGEYLSLFTQKVEHSGPNGGPIVLGNPWRGDSDPG
jgi:phage terminase small subunit